MAFRLARAASKVRQFAGNNMTAITRQLSVHAARFPTKAVVGGSAVGLAVATGGFTVAACGGTPMEGIPGTSKERTFIAVKPDGVQRNLVGEIIARFERKGYKLVGLKMVWPDEKMAQTHYADLSKKPFFPNLVKFFSSGPIVAMVWEGKDAIKTGRKLLGATNPSDSQPGTIRGDLCVETGRNICHGSDGPDSARDEIRLWWTAKELHDWTPSAQKWVIE